MSPELIMVDVSLSTPSGAISQKKSVSLSLSLSLSLSGDGDGDYE